MATKKKTKHKKKDEYYISHDDKTGEVQIYNVKTDKRGVTQAATLTPDKFSYKPTRWQRMKWRVKYFFKYFFSYESKTNKKRIKL